MFQKKCTFVLHYRNYGCFIFNCTSLKRQIMLSTVCFRPDPSPSPRPGPEPAWRGGRLPERLSVSRAWVRCSGQGNAGGLLRQVLRQRAKHTAQPSGTSHTTLASSGHGRCLPYRVSFVSFVCRWFLISCWSTDALLVAKLTFLFLLSFSLHKA